MHPYGGGGGLEAGHALGQKPTRDARQDVAGAGRTEPRRRVAVYRRTPIRRSDYGVAALVDDDGARTGGRLAGALELAAGRLAEQPFEFAFMRREDHRTVGTRPDRLEQRFRIVLEHRHRIGVDDVISTPDVQTVLDACYDAPSLDNAFCRLFDRHRGPGPGPGGESPGQIVNNSLHLQPFNFAAFKVSGLDVGASYGADVGGFGRFDAKLLYTLALRNDAFLDFDDAGRADQQLLELGNPRHALNWDIKLTRGIVSIEHQLRFFSRMSVDSIENIRSVQGRPPENEDAFSPRFFDSRTYHNIRVELNPLRHAELYFGIDNLTDQLPPPTLTGVDRGAIYDNVGRFFYAGATVRY